MEQLIAEIAEKHLRLETLEEQKSDRLDFKEHAVWNIKAALEAAYAAGAASTKLEAVTRQGK